MRKHNTIFQNSMLFFSIQEEEKFLNVSICWDTTTTMAS